MLYLIKKHEIMIKLHINNEERTLKDEFYDIKLNELGKAYKFISGLSPELKRYLVNEDEEKVDKQKLFEYKLHWVTLFSDFTVNELRLIPIKGDEVDDLSVEWLYNKCKLFLNQPESYIQLKEFKHKGKEYNLIEPITTIGGAEMLFGKANYRQFMLGSQLTAMVEKTKSENCISSLTQLFALLYTDGNDSSEDVVNRSRAFGDVNALYGWSAYFFFVELVKKYKDFFLLSTTKNPPRQVQKVLAIQQLKASLSKTTFGKWLLSKWLKQEYLILEM